MKILQRSQTLKRHFSYIYSENIFVFLNHLTVEIGRLKNSGRGDNDPGKIKLLLIRIVKDVKTCHASIRLCGVK